MNTTAAQYRCGFAGCSFAHGSAGALNLHRFRAHGPPKKVRASKIGKIRRKARRGRTDCVAPMLAAARRFREESDSLKKRAASLLRKSYLIVRCADALRRVLGRVGR